MKGSFSAGGSGELRGRDGIAGAPWCGQGCIKLLRFVRQWVLIAFPESNPEGWEQVAGSRWSVRVKGLTTG